MATGDRCGWGHCSYHRTKENCRVKGTRGFDTSVSSEGKDKSCSLGFAMDDAGERQDVRELCKTLLMSEVNQCTKK